MKQILRISLLLIGLASFGFGQTALTQTTLNGDVSGASVYSGNGLNSIDTSVTLTATTSVVAPNASSNAFGNLYTTSQGGQFASMLYVDGELMGVTGVNTTTKVVQVIRGIEGTQASDHPTGAMVLIGPPGAFQKYDPIGKCTAASTIFTPWVNVANGRQWLCSTLTKSWVPGFGNPGTSSAPMALSAAVASVAGTTTPSGPYFHISGTNAITAWGVPVGCAATSSGGCSFTVIPDAAFTTTATNNIATAVTAVANLAQIWTWDATNSKFVVIQSK
jgi:hypothetical protein